MKHTELKRALAKATKRGRRQMHVSCALVYQVLRDLDQARVRLAVELAREGTAMGLSIDDAIANVAEACELGVAGRAVAAAALIDLIEREAVA